MRIFLSLNYHCQSIQLRTVRISKSYMEPNLSKFKIKANNFFIITNNIIAITYTIPIMLILFIKPKIANTCGIKW